MATPKKKANKSQAKKPTKAKAKKPTKAKKPARKKARPIEYLDPNEPKPVWDGHKLMLGNRVLARLRQRAEEQIKILNAFQAAGWPDRISDPLDHSETLTPKDRLRNLVRKLNETVEHRGIAFLTDDGGTCLASPQTGAAEPSLSR